MIELERAGTLPDPVERRPESLQRYGGTVLELTSKTAEYPKPDITTDMPEMDTITRSGEQQLPDDYQRDQV